jgi:hypothetical protein
MQIGSRTEATTFAGDDHAAHLIVAPLDVVKRFHKTADISGETTFITSGWLSLRKASGPSISSFARSNSMSLASGARFSRSSDRDIANTRQRRAQAVLQAKAENLPLRRNYGCAPFLP